MSSRGHFGRSPLFVIVLLACVSGCGDDSDDPPQRLGAPAGGAPTGQQPGQSGPTAAQEAAIREVLEDALVACFDVVVQQETQAIRACRRTDDFRRLYEPMVAAVNQLLDRGRLTPEDRRLALYAPLDYRDDVIGLHHCNGNPFQPGANLNAYALYDATFMVDHFTFALIEAAAYFALYVEPPPDDPAQRDAWAGQLILDVGRIFYNANQGRIFEVVDAETAGAAFDGNPAAGRLARDAVTFIVAHELGHANLVHGPLKHMIHAGAAELERRGIIRADAEQRRLLDARLLELTVATEVQADIYALTLLQRSDASSTGIALLALGLGGMMVHTGQCDPSASTERFRDCFFMAVPGADHPPLDARTVLAQQILDEGRDYRHLLGADAWAEAYDLAQRLR